MTPLGPGTEFRGHRQLDNSKMLLNTKRNLIQDQTPNDAKVLLAAVLYRMTAL